MTVHIELLVVPGCPHQGAAERLIATAVADTAVKATITRTLVGSHDQARERNFTGSPTILLNGSDPFVRPDAPIAIACRLYPTPGGPRGVPGLRELRRAIKQAAAG